MRATLVSILLVCCGVLGCKDSSVSVLPTGTMRGQVEVMDSLDRGTADASGVLAELEGTPFHDVSVANGVFTLHDVPTGTYVLRLSKSGYATRRMMSVSFIGGGTQWEGSYLPMHPLVDFPVTIDSLEVRQAFDTISAVSFKIHVPQYVGAAANRSVRLIVSTVPDPDFNDPGSVVYSYDRSIVSYSSPDFGWLVPGDVLRPYAHRTLYVVTIPFGTDDIYFDIDRIEYVCTNVGTPSNHLSFAMP